MLNSSSIANTQKRAKITKTVKITVIAALLIMALSVFYSRVVFPYQNKETLGACVLKAKGNYDQQWTTTCLSLYGAELIKQYGKDKLCESMTAESAEPIEQNYQRQIDDCVNRYSNNLGK
jgi:hypothetical protein